MPLCGLLLLLFKFIPRRREAFITLSVGSIMGLASSAFQSWFYSSVNDMRFFYDFKYRLFASAAALGKTVLGWVFFPLNVVDVENWGQWLDLNRNYIPAGLGIWITFATLLFYAWFKKKEILLTALLLMGAFYIPVSGLLFPHRNFYSVRYLEPTFLILFIYLGATKAFERRKTLSAIFAIYCAAGLFFEGKNWEDSFAVLNKALRDSPNSIALKTMKLKEAHSFKKMRPENIEFALMYDNLLQELESQCASPLKTSDRFVHDGCWDFYNFRLSEAS